MLRCATEIPPQVEQVDDDEVCHANFMCESPHVRSLQEEDSDDLVVPVHLRNPEEGWGSIFPGKITRGSCHCVRPHVMLGLRSQDAPKAPAGAIHPSLGSEVWAQGALHQVGPMQNLPGS